MSVKVSVTHEHCVIRVQGMAIHCPLCKTLVKSGETHRCQRPKKGAPLPPRST